MAGVYSNGVRFAAGAAAGVHFNGVRMENARAWQYDSYYYWLGALSERIASPVGATGWWTDGVYHIEAQFCGWYTRGVAFTYEGDCDLRTLVGGLYTSAHLDRTVPASWHTSPCWTRSGSVLDQVTSDAVAQHFWGMDEMHPITGCTARAIGADVSVGGWYQYGTPGLTVTFEIQAMYRALVPLSGAVGVYFSAARMA